MRSKLTRAWRLSAGVLGAIATAGIVARAPVLVSFSVVVAEAVSWCVWLDHHPPA